MRQLIGGSDARLPGISSHSHTQCPFMNARLISIWPRPRHFKHFSRRLSCSPPPGTISTYSGRVTLIFEMVNVCILCGVIKVWLKNGKFKSQKKILKKQRRFAKQ